MALFDKITSQLFFRISYQNDKGFFRESWEAWKSKKILVIYLGWYPEDDSSNPA